MYRHAASVIPGYEPTYQSSVSAVVVAGLALTGAAAPASIDSTDSHDRPQNGVDLDRATVPVLQQDMNAHRLSSVALTGSHRRIALLNPTLHAVLEVNPAAIVEAVASDAHRLLQRIAGPLDGIRCFSRTTWTRGPRAHHRRLARPAR